MKHIKLHSMAALMLGGLMLGWLNTASGASAVNLRCEYLVDPLGIDVVKPRLSWSIESGRRGERQTAYQILAGSTPESLARDAGNLWDSGKTVSDQSIQVEYAGKPLATQMPCHWKVRVWDKDGTASAWSAPATWSMGLLQAADWAGAKWIGNDAPRSSTPSPLLRKSFTLTKAIKRRWCTRPVTAPTNCV